ncbi:unnamed protein product [Cyprideis torosa]|uniref:receptor protein serine/threonine kinase n=1 Tax=Cyprideis torosa TaxID=163714 RepID=A0A7R8ZL96_9CRUS|nr:unnamed protein product [Cyprideis torosa]CAG0892945.1 unnamed protein product [Cyprideis torosa]
MQPGGDVIRPAHAPVSSFFFPDSDSAPLILSTTMACLLIIAGILTAIGVCRSMEKRRHRGCSSKEDPCAPEDKQPRRSAQKGAGSAFASPSSPDSPMFPPGNCWAVFDEFSRAAGHSNEVPEIWTGFLQRTSSPPAADQEGLKLPELSGVISKQGRIQRVFAAKIYPKRLKRNWQTEVQTLALLEMEREHPNILRFYGATPSLDQSRYVTFVEMEPYHRGSLRTFLKDNTVSWEQFCLFGLGVAKGLAYLHSEVERNGGLSSKPAICLRNLSSQNILVAPPRGLLRYSSDEGFFSPLISDFSLSVTTRGKRTRNGAARTQATALLTEGDCLRYLAPEVLEGAVDLHDADSSLKQADVYALGLVLWEISWRCEDLYRGTPPMEYRLPFEEELGLTPTKREAELVVCRRKLRPRFPAVWTDMNPAVRLLKESLLDCWDPDGEARLTALCVEERFKELPLLWRKYLATLPTPNSSRGQCRRDAKTCQGVNYFSDGTDATSNTTCDQHPPDEKDLKNAYLALQNPVFPEISHGRNTCQARNTCSDPEETWRMANEDANRGRLNRSPNEYPQVNLSADIRDVSSEDERYSLLTSSSTAAPFSRRRRERGIINDVEVGRERRLYPTSFIRNPTHRCEDIEANTDEVSPSPYPPHPAVNTFSNGTVSRVFAWLHLPFTRKHSRLLDDEVNRSSDVDLEASTASAALLSATGGGHVVGREEDADVLPD